MSDPQDWVRRLLGPLDGARIPGGCDRCDAYQPVEATLAGVWKITVHHDDWCPWVAARDARTSR
jgi:hypothetical protein